MSISTYTELQTAVANWLGRSDLTSRIPEFITLAQNKINRRVKSLAMETKSTSFSITGEYVAVPVDFIEARNFYIPGSPPVILQQASPEFMDYTSSKKPRFFAVVGTNFRFAPAPDSTYTATLVYYAKPATLATTTQETNSLFPTHADLYLYATLLEAEAYVANDPRLAVWKQGYEDALAEINGVSARGRWGGNMSVRPG